MFGKFSFFWAENICEKFVLALLKYWFNNGRGQQRRRQHYWDEWWWYFGGIEPLKCSKAIRSYSDHPITFRRIFQCFGWERWRSAVHLLKRWKHFPWSKKFSPNLTRRWTAREPSSVSSISPEYWMTPNVGQPPHQISSLVCLWKATQHTPKAMPVTKL